MTRYANKFARRWACPNCQQPVSVYTEMMYHGYTDRYIYRMRCGVCKTKTTKRIDGHVKQYAAMQIQLMADMYKTMVLNVHGKPKPIPIDYGQW